MAALWHLRKKDLRIFHLVLGYNSPRVQAELHSSRETIRWMSERKHLTRDSRYTEINLSTTSPWSMCVDIPAVGVWIGAIVRMEKDITSVCRVIIGDGSGNTRDTPVVSNSIEIAEAIAGQRIKWEFPFENIPKKDLVKGVPRELMDFAISCWGPTLDPLTGKWQQCGSCEKCGEMRSAGLLT